VKNYKNLIKAWEAVKTVERNVEIRKREFAREARTEFETGEPGDVEFLDFVTKHLKETVAVGQYLLALALAARAFTGEKDFDFYVAKTVKRLAQMPAK
jgi:hypothetical protein